MLELVAGRADNRVHIFIHFQVLRKIMDLFNNL